MDANQQIVLDNLSVRYRGEDEAALKGISLTAKTGQIIGIIGNSRSGKTTLCDVLSGIIPNIVSGHVSGTVRLGEFSPFEAFDEYNFHTGVVLQNTAGQLSGLSDTVFDEIAFGLINQGMSEEEAAKSVVRAACQMGLEDLLEQAPDTLSGGQTQRLAIASEIAFDPEFLIMDDPTSQMDPVGRKEFFEWLAGCSEKTIFIVSNEVDDLCEIADQLWVLEKGELIASGKPLDVINQVAEGHDLYLPVVYRMAKELGKKLPSGLFPVKLSELKGCFDDQN
ncbi:energy-coupling factor ABC transporter ATP-binding protein [Ligilactobacillus ruminis]|uniref:ATP-binding cassette domain-containing protein n=1 Tax=Ligilactobacillus ruminis TaxID=1623 RepID=A0A6A8H1M4_9LACO|nr:ABC transporter ATP-binding protein [Ligilactobacillus ruminis]KLA48674.1 cobalt ABC transporter ATP-binding protein [Ligilactobacillus ruminis S23]MSA20283.1 ATP-binding cassette domain-containing protein [Ligilactobacillus ruminis]MSA22375.1 ATP-binding cassette domain-containing protein [Ligilactobacillus ruminis]MSA24414.1 ATP-binding cassette domain-containing protein [Ligilactobacillus ruminis]MSA34663.1 ATP-binding cassette domain-containing protein [Ligilactobacillus ruminis]